ncbi:MULTISPECIES: type I-MYXAN CRISPR-associated protein Cas6/Cmx6 [unclassified Nostoc]|uniref:type I-MYXAN CRISPR-associated protein Cas6/Cmx6 n=1 Tax=unclassified Nostoc TaxID=2593658 RepID=UPI000B9551AA|nr:type I-MYXAN CRISPR-associated protein Cas6/Cmx6 [Nostoc sp. 'Peltigera membranacea cyanobiont' 232]OYE03549.1 type I-MYXAN CRISPR-associated protein Cas6/Cmx6 [Nostoc sp. 'Peltigera membranacea cyanobiont' 232]
MAIDYRLTVDNCYKETLACTNRKEFLTCQLQLIYADLSFRAIGQIIAIDHCYHLYSGISKFQPKLHDSKVVRICRITGNPDKFGKLHLNQNSRLRIRLPVDKIPLFYSLAGKSLRIGEDTIRLSIPQIELLQPTEKLRSRIVIIKRCQEPRSFLKVAQRQIEQLGIKGTVNIQANFDGTPKRRTIKVKESTLVGFGLEVKHLSEEDSLILQAYSIGGKHKMGCGFFVPLK